MITLDDAYCGRRVLVTGHTGFKGSWLVLWLKQLGAEVTGIALRPETPLFNACNVAGDCESHFADIQDFDAINQIIKDATPEIVMHLAAQSLVGASYDDPRGTMASNVMGTVNVMEAIRQTPSVQAVLAVSTDKVYANIGTEKTYVEDDPLGGNDPYSASKGAAEIAFQSYCKSFFKDSGARAASARSGNVIGGGDWAAYRLLPDLMRSAETGIPLILRHPEAIRPWQHVLEPLRGYLLLGARLLADNSAAEGPWNFGPCIEDAATVRDVIATVKNHWPEINVIEDPDSATFHEEKFLLLNNAKAEQELGWFPKIRLNHGLQLTAEWYKSYLNSPSAARAITLEQISTFGF